MKELIAKKYVKALMAELSKSELEKFIDSLNVIANAFKIHKFRNIIISPNVKSCEKVKFILSLIDETDTKFTNFIKLLGENKRLELLPAIVAELMAQKARIDNVYRGKIYGNFDISATQIEELEKSFSKRFDAKIMLEAIKSDYNGIKIELDDLGVEASFFIDRLKAQMTEYILKAI
ncbi:F0F1 ATP synthase subunit delta [Campylobacter sp. CCUG 57310]|uniref:F0F1 ATP synthase subunit delta n=1 Tax=Campylobacter sp. CCUG 57310 TaxID=2517362 RepID=UPI00156789DA|nr:F0F1 ATP synthase subunit delta [Campylobacter sp. CCUG 57310]QKF92813.1 ATP synthase, F1 complex, delta subunit [Campylobacter sp. CCUG 57310]